MLAFVDSQVSKPEVVAALKRHQALDHIARGCGYWTHSESRGCAVGCTIHDFKPGFESHHDLYSSLFGIPEGLARLHDFYFERLPIEKAPGWALDFIETIPPGADLAPVWPRFACWLLVDPQWGVSQYATEAQRPAIQRVADLYQALLNGKPPTADDWERAANAANAAYAAYDAYDAYDAYAVDVAAYAAYAAAYAAAYEAYATANAAANAAANVANAANAADAADAANVTAAADQLLTLLKAA